MIPDYKIRSPHHRRKKRGRKLLLVATLVLAATLLAVRFLEPGAVVAVPGLTEAKATTGNGPIVTPLSLPGSAAEPAPTTGLQKTATPDQASMPVAPSIPMQPAQTEAEPPLPLEQTSEALQEAAVAGAPSLLGDIVGTDQPERAELSAPNLPEPVASQPTAQSAGPGTGQWLEHTVSNGDSLARIFQQHGLSAKLLHRIVNSSESAASLAKIRPGQTLRFRLDEDQELTRMELHRNRVESLRVAIADDAVTTEEISKDVEKRVASAAGLIESSLFVDGQRAGLADGQIMELATIFGWDIDFALEIRAGDQFRVLYEEHFLDGEKLRDGPILAAEFTNRGTTYRALRYEDGNGEIAYFDADGHNKRRAFIRTPIRFARVSSRYNPRRWHPVLKRWRSHKGVDYAAPTGTPIKATGDGRVTFRGTKGGYGRTVILEHAGKYTTLYAHMSKYSPRAKVGARVKQGQVIGYVGQSGLASGPHLHYEFRVDGVHKDPLRVSLPKTLALPGSELAKFREATLPLIARLEAIPSETLVAQAEATEER